MSEENPRLKKLITWKDADQNLCTLAASMLDEASRLMRGRTEFPRPVQTTEGPIEPGFAEDGSKRTIYSDMTESPITVDRKYPVQCWWAFQNIIRQELSDARQEIYDNLYRQDREGKRSKQSTRNEHPGTRPKSKFGRTPER